MNTNSLLRRIALLASALALGVIIFGSFVRLSNAGLSCPDWPTCYGEITWPKADHEIAAANQEFERAVESHKTWREQLHRHLAAILGLLVLSIALLAAADQRGGRRNILLAAALVAISIPLYIMQKPIIAVLLASLGELILIASAWHWRARPRVAVGILVLAVIVFQAVLGMWTVTWLLKPIVVMAHLMGGLATLGLLTWLTLRCYNVAARPGETLPRRSLVIVGLALLAVQISLGGWTSANYAAWACGTDFPTCLGQWWPQADYREGFVLWRGIGVDYEGGILDGPARTAIQMVHRLFAILLAGHLLMLCWRLIGHRQLRAHGIALLVLLSTQIGLGIANVKLGLPLHAAVAHNAVAALLMLSLIFVLARLTPTRH